MGADLFYLSVNVPCCPRCEQPHVGLKFEQLRNPPNGGPTHWAMCSMIGQPLLLTYTQSDRNPQ